MKLDSAAIGEQQARHQREEFSGALRHDRYSDFGNATTAKLSARWQPTRSLLFRGSVGSGFKAPTVPQTSATRQLFDMVNDPYERFDVAAAHPDVVQAFDATLAAAARTIVRQ